MSLLPVVVLSTVLATVQAREQRIKHVVVLMEENRPFDHFFGWSNDLLGTNGLSGSEFNYVDPSNPESEKVFVNNEAPLMNECDPGHSTSATTAKLFSTATEDRSVADMGGFVDYQKNSADKNYCNVMGGFPPEKVPVATALAQEYAIMDRFFAAHPGPTWPNRMFTLSGTSAGNTETSVWYKNIPGALYPQKTIFDQVEEASLSWKNYYNDTPWELIMEKVAHSPANLQPMDSFYHDASTGNLPSFSWINPRSGINVTTGVGSNDQHPDHDISAGEQFYKDVYEAVRASPQWNETLFVITWDEHGGFYDHVIPPSENIPPPGDGEDSYFAFDRLGVRIPAILISPWIKKGTVISDPPDDENKAAKPYNNSEFDLTSIIASARRLLGMEDKGLTDRDDWSARFDYAVYELDEPRVDCPMHMPDALEPTAPTGVAAADKPLNDLQLSIAAYHSTLTGNPVPDHDQTAHAHWLETQYKLHAARTLRWRQSKDSDLRVVIQPGDWYAKSRVSDHAWHMNGLPFGEPNTFNSSTPFITVSTWDLRTEPTDIDDDAVPYCLDAGHGRVGSALRVSACYPSEDPTANRDVLQRFVLRGDGALQFYDPRATEDLCVTNHDPQLVPPERSLAADGPDTNADLSLSLQPCVRILEQNWAYHGKAPGDGGGGHLEFGDIEWYLGVIGSDA